MITQNEYILEHMKNVGPITPIIALQEYGCMRLGARIKDLRNMGVEIDDRWISRKNRLGQTKRFKEYWLK